MVCKKTITILLIIITIIMIMQFVNEYKEAMVMQRKAKASFAAIAKKAQTNPYNKQDTPQWGGEGGGSWADTRAPASFRGRAGCQHGMGVNPTWQGMTGGGSKGKGSRGKGRLGASWSPLAPGPPLLLLLLLTTYYYYFCSSRR